MTSSGDPLVPRHSDALITRRYGLYVICLVIACVGGPLVFGRSYIYPGHETTFSPSEFQPVGYFSRDPMGQFAELAFARFSTEAIRSGEIPYWNPYTGLGLPFLADQPMSALFAPQNWLRVVLPPTLWDVIFVLNILIGSYCLFRWLTLSGLDPEAAAVGALSWWALGTTQIYFNVPSIVNVVTALPVALFGIEAQARNHGSRQGRVLTAVGAFGVVVGGHVTVTFICGIFLITYLAVRTLVGGGVKTGGRAVLWLAIGVLVAACQWLPFVEYLRFRGNTLPDYTQVRFLLVHLPALVVPSVYGFLNSVEPPVPGGVSLGNYSSLGWISPAIGILLIPGLVVGFRRSLVGSACLGAALVCYAWSFGLPVLQHASNALPFLNRIQGNYFPLVANVALPFFVAQGFRWIRDGGRRRAPVAMLAWLTLMVAALICAAALVRPASGSVTDTLDLFVRRSWPSWAWMIVTVIAWMAFAPRANEVDRFTFWTGVVVFGAVAFYPWAGASLRKEAFAASAAALFLLLAIVRVGRRFDIEALRLALVTLLLFVVHGVVTFSGTGLPKRHELLATATYPGFLRSELTGTTQRAYGILGYLFPNRGPVERIATLNTLVAMVPLQVEKFMEVLDEKQSGVQLLGLAPVPPVGHDSATAAVLQNRSLWNYIGSRFIVAPLDGFVDRILPGSAFEVRDGWPGDGSVPMQLPARGTNTAGNTWSIVCGGDDWQAVVVRVGTYGGATAQGELDLELRGNDERVLARTHLDGGRVQDSGFATLFVGRPFCRANDTLRL